MFIKNLKEDNKKNIYNKYQSIIEITNDIVCKIEKKYWFDKKIYFVWGTTRDIILWNDLLDLDLTWNLSQDEIYWLFWWSKQESFWTVVFSYENLKFEYTPFRIEWFYNGRRNIENIKFVETILEDYIRRDFTINAIYLNLKTFEFIDYSNWFSDLSNGLLKTIWHSYDKLTEDPLRILRTLRFSCKLNIKIDSSLENAIKISIDYLKELSKQRIKQEIEKSINIPNYIQTLSNFHILELFFPEFEKMKWLDQKTRHHKFDVLNHSLQVLSKAIENFPNKSTLFYLSCLFHDIWKPTQFNESRKFEIGSKEFHTAKDKYNHAIIWEKMILEILSNYCFDKKDKDYISNMVFFHQDIALFSDTKTNLTAISLPKQLKRLIKEINDRIFYLNSNFEFIKDLVDLSFCDKYWTGTQSFETVQNWYNPVKDSLNHIIETDSAISLKDLEINWNDLLNLWYIWKEIKLKLEECLKLIFENENLNTKDFLLEYCKKEEIEYKIDLTDIDITEKDINPETKSSISPIDIITNYFSRYELEQKSLLYKDEIITIIWKNKNTTHYFIKYKIPVKYNYFVIENKINKIHCFIKKTNLLKFVKLLYSLKAKSK